MRNGGGICYTTLTISAKFILEDKIKFASLKIKLSLSN